MNLKFTALHHLIVVFATHMLVACSGTSSGAPPLPTQAAPHNSEPEISGVPITSALVGELYSFQPEASDPDGDVLTFSVTNLPAWASFDTRTGEIAGEPQPAHIGQTNIIEIRVSDGQASVALPGFTIDVTAPSVASSEPEPPIAINAPNVLPISDGAVDVPIGSTLEVTLPVDMNPAEVLADLTDAGSGVRHAVTVAASLEAIGKLVIDPEFDLQPNIDYELEVRDGNSSIKLVFRTAAVKWHAGGYVLLAVDQGVDATSPSITSPAADNMGGVAIRISWPSMEDDEGNYDFSPLTRALEQTALAGKKASISLFSVSQTLSEPALAQPEKVFYSLNRNPNNPTTCSRINDPFDDNFRGRYYRFLHALGRHLRDNPELNDTVTYVIGAGDLTTRNWAYGVALESLFANADCTQPITWEAAGFSVDSMTSVLRESISMFAEAFPDKVQWFSVGDMRFDSSSLTCGSTTCLATDVAAWALANYPDRVGIWREDLSANRGSPRNGSLWWEISRHRPRLGAQMVWNVQACDVTGSTNCRVAADGTPKETAMREALSVGLSNDTLLGYGNYLMNYVEIYAADTRDEDLEPVFREIAESVGWTSDNSPPSVPQHLLAVRLNSGTVEITWSASTDAWDKETIETEGLLPSSDLSSTQSVTYEVYRDGVAIGTSGSLSFLDRNPASSSATYSLVAVDAAGNKSLQSAAVPVS